MKTQITILWRQIYEISQLKILQNQTCNQSTRNVSIQKAKKILMILYAYIPVIVE